jgi:hypothetical protein
MSRHAAPSRAATWLLARLLPARDRDAIIGDLVEEYALRAQSSSSAIATRWYWGQVCRSLPAFLWSSLKRGQWIGTVGVAMVMYVVANGLEAIGDVAISRLLHLTPESHSHIVVSLVVGLTTMALGGYVAARTRRNADMVLASLILIGVAVLMVAIPDSVPLWYQIAFLVAGPLASLAGGWLFVRRRTAWRSH